MTTETLPIAMLTDNALNEVVETLANMEAASPACKAEALSVGRRAVELLLLERELLRAQERARVARIMNMDGL